MSLLMFRLKSQIPQITQTLEILQHMQKKKVCIFFVEFLNENILYPIFHMFNKCNNVIVLTDMVLHTQYYICCFVAN